jgi:hypothetical protein
MCASDMSACLIVADAFRIAFCARDCGVPVTTDLLVAERPCLVGDDADALVTRSEIELTVMFSIPSTKMRIIKFES